MFYNLVYLNCEHTLNNYFSEHMMISWMICEYVTLTTGNYYSPVCYIMHMAWFSSSSTLSTNTSRCSAKFLLFLPCQSWHKVKDFLVIQDTELQNLPIVLQNQLTGLLNQLILLQNQPVILHLRIPLQQSPLILLPWLFLFSFLSGSSSYSPLM